MTNQHKYIMTGCFFYFVSNCFEVYIHSKPIKDRAVNRHYWRLKGVYGRVQKVYELGKSVHEVKVTFCTNDDAEAVSKDRESVQP